MLILRVMTVSVMLAAGAMSAAADNSGSAGKDADLSANEQATGPEKPRVSKAEGPSVSTGNSATQVAAVDDTTGSGEAAEAAKPAKPKAVATTLSVSINLSSQTMVVSEHGSPIHTFKISSGKRSHPTPTGTFRPQWMARKWNSRKYDWAPMPYSVFIHGGVAIHGTTHTGMLGRPASHGCIRLSNRNARTFFNLVQKHGKSATKVSVYGTPNFGRSPAVASRRKPKKTYSQYDDGGWFFGGPSAYDSGPAARKAKRKRAVKRPYRIVRGSDGRRYRVYVNPEPSFSWF